MGISLPRALGPLFAIFEGNPIGFLFSAIQILVYDQYGRISFGIREPDRRKKWIGDFCVAGMVPSKTDILKVAKDEMFEEIGLSQDIWSHIFDDYDLHTHTHSKLYSDSASAILNMGLIAKYRRFDSHN